MSTSSFNLQSFVGGAALFVLLFSAGACSSSRDSLAEDTSDDVAYENTSNIPGAFPEVSIELRQEKEALVSQLDQGLNRVDMKIEEIEDRAKNASAEVKQEYKQAVDRMDKEREKLVKEYQKVEEATSETWDDVKAEVQEIMQEVEQNVNELAASLDR